MFFRADKKFGGVAARAAGALCLTSLVVASITCPISANATNPRGMARIAGQLGGDAGSKLAGHIDYSRISPPLCGVKLLEDIFLRVRSTPEVAMLPALKQQQAQQALAEPTPDSGATNYKLAIRPKQAGKTIINQAPAIQFVPSPAMQNQVSGITGPAQPELRIAFAPPPPLPPSKYFAGSRSLSTTNQPGVWTTQSSAGAGGGAGLPPVSTGRSVRSPGDNIYGGESTDQSLLDGVSTGTHNTGITQRGSGIAEGYYPNRTQQQTPPNLAAAIKRLYNVTKGIQEVQKVAEDMPASAPAKGKERAEEIAYDKSEAKSAAHSLDSRGSLLKKAVVRDQRSAPAAAPRGSSYRAPHEMQIIDDKPVANALGGGGGGAASLESRLDKDQLSAADEEVDRRSGERQKHKSRKAGLKQSKPQAGNEKIAWSSDNLALVPPNVVTGIPLIRLGIAEHQASNALNALGNMQQLKVNKWTVWTWQRAQNKEIALQLYIRNGLLDAMRIFDPSLIAPGFGVSLGDYLGSVKEKFGEPAFILPEPSPGAGQNYIYPISQVGFQIARPSPDQKPKVVSVLIFNVK